MYPLVIMLVGLTGIIFCGCWVVYLRRVATRKRELQVVAAKVAENRVERDRLRAEARRLETKKQQVDADRAIQSMLVKRK